MSMRKGANVPVPSTTVRVELGWQGVPERLMWTCRPCC